MPSLDFDFEKARFRTLYAQNLPSMHSALESFLALLSTLITPSAHIDGAKVEGRIKSADECVRKFSRKYRAALEDKNTPYEIGPYITDMIGLRIVCLYEDELAHVVQAVRTQFEVMEITDKVSAVESTESAFGYKGLHLDLRLDAAHRAMPRYALLAPLTLELQIRTIIQDSWSVLDHKIKYKKAIPGPLKRRINVLAALFELADREFAMLPRPPCWRRPMKHKKRTIPLKSWQAMRPAPGCRARRAHLEMGSTPSPFSRLQRIFSTNSNLNPTRLTLLSMTCTPGRPTSRAPDLTSSCTIR